MNSVEIRPFQDADLPFAERLSAAAGWNQTSADWLRFQLLSAGGMFVAVQQQVVCGTVACFAFGRVGWIAMMLVDEPYRGRGIGRRLMEFALQHLGANDVDCIRLDATPLGRPLYEKMGFVEEYTLTRFGGCVLAPNKPTAPSDTVLEDLTQEEWETCMLLDATCLTVDRRRLLSCLFQESPRSLLGAKQEGRLVGYLTARPGRLATFLGPGVALDESAGAALLKEQFWRHRGMALLVDIPNSQSTAYELAESSGLTARRALTRMRRGSVCTERLSSLWCSSGPEKG